MSPIEETIDEGDLVELIKEYKSERGNRGAHFIVPVGTKAVVESIIYNDLVLEQFDPKVQKVNCDEVEYCSIPVTYVKRASRMISLDESDSRLWRQVVDSQLKPGFPGF